MYNDNFIDYININIDVKINTVKYTLKVNVKSPVKVKIIFLKFNLNII